MTEAVGNLRANLTADWADFRSELQRSAGAVGDFAKGFQQAAGRITRDAAGLFGGIQLGRFINDSIQAAQEAQETAGAFRAAFGDQADAAEDWSSRTHDAFRVTEAELQTVATRFQNLFGEISPTNEAAAETSERFTELTRDFAELKNIGFDQAVDRISSALAGSARAMRQYGIDLSETALKQEGLRTGVITANQSLSAEQATLLRASILMRELGDATGETARQTGDAEAESQRLTQEYQEQSQQLGEALLPAMTTLKGFLADLLQGYTDAARGVGRFIESNDVLLAQAYQVRSALRGQFVSFEVAMEGVRRYRQGVDEAAPATEALGEQIRGTTGETEAFANSLAEQAATLEDGPRTRSGGRSWAQRHENDLRRIMEGYDAAGAALRQYNEDVEIARRGGLDMAQAQRALAMQFIENIGGVDQLAKGMRDDLPEPIRLLAEELIPKLTEAAGTADDRFRAFAQSLNEQFNQESAVRGELAQIQRALDEGLISLETYIRAKNELLGGDPEAGLRIDTTADQERIQQVTDRIESLKSGLADLATGTRDFGDAWREVLLNFLRSQWIEPFLERILRLINTGTSGGNKSGGIFSGGTSILGNVIGGIFGGKREHGGDVRAGVSYEVGERGRELFVPDEDGTIMPTGSYGAGVTMNIYTPDANSFRASRRQIARDERRKVGVS